MTLYIVRHTEKRNARVVTSRPMSREEAECAAADLRCCGDIFGVEIVPVREYATRGATAGEG